MNAMFGYVFLCILSYVFVSVYGKPKVAIIGAGIGGTSCAAFLKDLFSGNVDIDIYEKAFIGGRLATVQYNYNDFETGGAVLMPNNHYMNQFVKRFNMKKKMGKTRGKSAIYDGYHGNIIASFRMQSRYGTSIQLLAQALSDIKKKIIPIYGIQHYKESFDTLGQMLTRLDPGFQSFYTNISIYQFLKDYVRTNEQMILELVQASIRATYGQSVYETNAVTGFVALGDLLGPLWSVEGGNKKVAEHCLFYSNAKFYNSQVVQVIRKGNYNCVISVNRSNVVMEKCYDFVVIAAPLAQNIDNMEFVNYEKPINVNGRFHRTVTTVVDGHLRDEYFRSAEKLNNLSTIINLQNGDFNIITKLQISGIPWYSDINTWRIYSENILTDKQVHEMFTNVKVISVTDWLAYPEYSDSKTNVITDFALGQNLFYINAIEWAASTIEMSVIGAKNVALLVYKEFTKPVSVKIVNDRVSNYFRI